mmetsp:Transcript_131641/g.214343  ORF Transcript_131641/g.214343 Transcript_131641/m.214343 type:complete len:88 (+) Transcript_131641:523-786(+)
MLALRYKLLYLFQTLPMSHTIQNCYKFQLHACVIDHSSGHKRLMFELRNDGSHSRRPVMMWMHVWMHQKPQQTMTRPCDFEGPCRTC